jgi:RNA polymerase sigma-70 factor (ECF subfamily)
MKASRSAGEPSPRAEPVTFEGLYEEYFEFTWRVLRNLAVHPRLLEDVAQEVWAVVHRRLPGFEHRSSVRTWLFGIAFNVARSQRRAEARHEALELMPDGIDARVPDPEAQRGVQEAWLSLGRFLDALDERDRAIFVSNLIEDLSASETAEAVGVGVIVVYQRVRTLRRLARDWLELHDHGSMR